MFIQYKRFGTNKLQTVCRCVTGHEVRGQRVKFRRRGHDASTRSERDPEPPAASRGCHVYGMTQQRSSPGPGDKQH